MAKILSTSQKKRKRRVVAGFTGTYIPKSIADYITLYTTAFVVTKISILSNLLAEWVKEQQKTHSVDELQILIAQKAFTAWTKMEGKSFETFTSMIQFELRKKKLPPEIVGKILTLIKEEYEKETKRK